MHDLPQHQIDNQAIEFLNKGFNFVVVPRRLPNEEIMSSIESAINEIEHEAELIHQEV